MFKLKNRRNRSPNLTVSTPSLATYTIDSDYVSYTTIIVDGEEEDRKILPLGTVLAFNPSTKKAVPNYSSYGFGYLGVLQDDINCGTGNWIRNVVADVIYRGDVVENRCWDNGTFGSVLDATKNALAGRISFVDSDYF